VPACWFLSDYFGSLGDRTSGSNLAEERDYRLLLPDQRHDGREHRQAAACVSRALSESSFVHELIPHSASFLSSLLPVSKGLSIFKSSTEQNEIFSTNATRRSEGKAEGGIKKAGADCTSSADELISSPLRQRIRADASSTLFFLIARNQSSRRALTLRRSSSPNFTFATTSPMRSSRTTTNKTTRWRTKRMDPWPV
jgi:hypothetical protein